VFTLGSLIKAQFPTAEVIDQYQDSAVARGMRAYLKVLKGSEKDLLLLNVMTKNYGVKCSDKSSDYFPASGSEVLTFSCKRDENVLTAYLLRHNDTALSRGLARCVFAPGEGEGSIDLIESLPNDTEPLVIGRLVISTLANLKQGVVLLFDSESEGIVVVNLSFPGTGVTESFQINQTHVVPIGYELVDDNDLGGNWQVSASGVRRVKSSK
jgi:hypothetical protein